MNRPSVYARAVVAACTSTGVLLMGGCSAFQPKMQDVTIDSYPSGASIRVDGKDVGVAPVKIPLERNQRHTVVASLGGEAVTRQLNPHVSTTGILDIVGAVLFLVPAIGIATPGFWTVSDLNPTLILPSAANGTPAPAMTARAATLPPPAATPAPVKVAAKPATATPPPTKSASNDPNFKPAQRIKIYDD